MMDGVSEAADDQPGPGEFLPGGTGYDAWIRKLADDIAAAHELPDGLRFEWERIRAERDAQ